eukprot:TRINITY_DN12683_c0_g2_i2.p1 TRINITY_DN12683_c0_g2~~TRINITY_DN12683_c0_g2_i2.p1  ORF type:complete len:857 (+),score=116.89 TRINITY_DN12683_c0_g2_i2:34-2604(+)
MEPVEVDDLASQQEHQTVKEEISDGDVAIMFKKSAFIASEGGDACVYIEIIRLGPTDLPCSVLLCASAVDGEGTFKLPKKQTIAFASGERQLRIPVPIKRNQVWTGIRIESISLSDPKPGDGRDEPAEAKQHVKLGPLSRAKIMVSEFDRYPDGQSVESDPLSGWQMMRAFIVERIRSRGWKFVQTIIAMTYLALFGVLDSLIFKFVIDIALGGENCVVEESSIVGNITDEGSRITSSQLSLLFGSAYVLCFACCHLADRVQLDKRGRSGTRKWLRNSLILRYLYLSDIGIQGIGDGEIMSIMVSQVEEVVNGWYMALIFYRCSMEVLFNLSFQLWLIMQKVPIEHFMLVVVVTFVTICATIACRQRQFFHLIRVRQDSEDKWVSLAEELVEARRLLQIFDAVDRQVRRFEMLYEEFYKKHRASRFYQQTSEWLPKWALALALAGLYAFAPTIVAAYHLSASDFAAFLKSLQKLRKGIQGMHKSVVACQRSTVAIYRVADVLNREDRIGERARLVGSNSVMETCEFSRLEDLDRIILESVSFEYGKPLQLESYQMPTTITRTPSTKVQIWSNRSPKVAKVVPAPKYDDSFHFRSNTVGNVASASIFQELTAQVPCRSGDLICLTGFGRRTFLRMLAELVFPIKGGLLFSPHRRCVLVDRSPQIVKDTAFMNLRLGRRQAWEIGLQTSKAAGDMPPDASEPDLEALKRLCAAVALACGVSESIAKNLDALLGGPGMDRLTTRDSVAITLARAVLARPHALLIDSLGDSLGPDYLEGYMLPVLRRYAQGGLHEVVEQSELLSDEQRSVNGTEQRHSQMTPVVLWSSKVLPNSAREMADTVLDLDGFTFRIGLKSSRVR